MQEDAAAGQVVSGVELRRQLANAFDAGLYRLAVMSQPPDDAKDLGQDLPTGLIDSVGCKEPNQGGRPASSTSCEVHWETPSGARRVTKYEVRLLPGGCFAAGAQPPYPQRHDATIETYSEHPLNTLVSADPRCT